MTVDAAKAFLERMKTDEKFRKHILETTDKHARNKTIFEAGFEGFDLTDDNVRELMKEVGEDDEAMNVVRAFYHPTLGCGW